MIDVDAGSILDAILVLAAAFLLAMPIAWHRELETRVVGLRTFPLVALASCAYVLLARGVVGTDEQALARVLQGLMTGIGFVGGGAILKSSEQVKGTSTAAAIWATGAVGAACAWGRLDLAAAIAGITYFTFLVLTPIEARLEADEGKGEAE